MQNPFEIPLERLELTIKFLKPELIHALAVEGLRFVDDNFRQQGYQGRTFIPWKIQQHPDKPRQHKILILNAVLLRSFFATESPESARIGTDSRYAQVHNEGGSIRHPYREVQLHYTGKPGSLRLAKLRTESQQRRVTTVRHSSIYNHVTQMPQRQFIPTSSSPSPVLAERCQGIVIKKITAQLKESGYL